jgi:hypothetical protein
MPNLFHCPECGSNQAGERIQVNPSQEDTTPWKNAFSRTACLKCGYTIPTAIAERWNNETLEEASRIWATLFREHRQAGPHTA